MSGVPARQGLRRELTAQDVAHKLTGCQGTARFDVASASTVPVAVNMTCHLAPAVVTAPPAVPLPRGAGWALAALLLALGASRLRRPTA